MLLRVIRAFTLFLLVMLISATACSVQPRIKPLVVIQSPPSGSQFREGEQVLVRSTVTNSVRVVRVELVVDDQVAHTDSSPATQIVFPLTQTWRATIGSHTIVVRAHTATGEVSDPVAVSVMVLAQPTVTPVPTILPPTFTPSPTPTCTDNATFVADVTVPDGTPWMPGQAFNKIWRVRNTGCPWREGYQLVFVSGEAMSASRVFPLPQTANGATADLLVAMSAPNAPGIHTGVWRLRNASGAFFGTSVTVVIQVLGEPITIQTPTACSGAPSISSFTASQTMVQAGSTVTLNWNVANADSVEIDQGVGRFAPSASAPVKLLGTTTYTLTARCGGDTTTAQVTVSVPFAILGSMAGTDTPDVSGACPKTISFGAVIIVNAQGTVTYKWESTDGLDDSGMLSIYFDAPGQQIVTTSWTLGAPGRTYSNYWKRLHIFSPTDVISNQAVFTLRCN